MASSDRAGLFTTIRNTAGRSRPISYLPPHGVRLDDDEAYTVFGHLTDRLKTPRARAAFEADLLSGDITIVNTPAVVLLDSVTHLGRILDSANGVVKSHPPSWDDSDSLLVAH